METNIEINWSSFCVEIGSLCSIGTGDVAVGTGDGFGKAVEHAPLCGSSDKPERLWFGSDK